MDIIEQKKSKFYKKLSFSFKFLYILSKKMTTFNKIFQCIVIHIQIK
jgi:hypothetical protein